MWESRKMSKIRVLHGQQCTGRISAPALCMPPPVGASPSLHAPPAVAPLSPCSQKRRHLSPTLSTPPPPCLCNPLVYPRTLLFQCVPHLPHGGTWELGLQKLGEPCT